MIRRQHHSDYSGIGRGDLSFDPFADRIIADVDRVESQKCEICPAAASFKRCQRPFGGSVFGASCSAHRRGNRTPAFGGGGRMVFPGGNGGAFFPFPADDGERKRDKAGCQGPAVSGSEEIGRTFRQRGPLHGASRARAQSIIGGTPVFSHQERPKSPNEHAEEICTEDRRAA